MTWKPKRNTSTAGIESRRDFGRRHYARYRKMDKPTKNHVAYANRSEAVADFIDEVALPLARERDELRAQLTALESAERPRFAFCPEHDLQQEWDEDFGCTTCGRNLISLTDSHSVRTLRFILSTMRANLARAATAARNTLRESK